MPRCRGDGAIQGCGGTNCDGAVIGPAPIRPTGEDAMLSMARYGTRDVKRAKAFYDAISAPLGASRVLDRHGVVGYRGAEGGMFLIGTPLQGEANVGNGTQMGFAAPSREAVDAAYAKALELGGKCEGPPGLRANGLYAAYFRDLDGNKLYVFHRGE